MPFGAKADANLSLTETGSDRPARREMPDAWGLRECADPLSFVRRRTDCGALAGHCQRFLLVRMASCCWPTV